MMSARTSTESCSMEHSGVCCITFIGSNSLRLTDFPPELWAPFQQVVTSSWHKGIESLPHDRRNRCSYVKLRGYAWTMPFPCSSTSPDQGAGASRLLLALLRFMLSKGWAVELTLSKRGEKCGDELIHYSWIFTKVMEEKKELPVMCCVDFKGTDTIRVVEGCSEVSEAVKSYITTRCFGGVQEHKSSGDVEHFKLRGRARRSKGSDGQGSLPQLMLLPQLLLALRNVGWTIYSALEVQDYEGSNSVPIFNRWILTKPQDRVIDEEAPAS